MHGQSDITGSTAVRVAQSKYALPDCSNDTYVATSHRQQLFTSVVHTRLVLYLYTHLVAQLAAVTASGRGRLQTTRALQSECAAEVIVVHNQLDRVH